jgi:CheY-like chemotaxis protein
VTPRSRILVVEDDDPSREVMALALQDGGYAVDLVEDGAAALARAAAAPPDLVVLDLRMPVLDGAGFLRAYRARPGPRVPVLLVTAATNPAAAGAELDVDAVLAKPFDLTELYRTIEELLRTRPKADRP